MIIHYNGLNYSLTYSGTVVTIRQLQAGDFDGALGDINRLLGYFRQSQPGSIWGCDGIGYMLEKSRGTAFRNKSGVGPRKYKQGLENLKKEGYVA